MYGIFHNGQVIARFAAPLQVKSNQPLFTSDALSLKRVITQSTSQRWEIESNLEPLTDNAHKLFSLFTTRGFSVGIDVIMPQNYGAVKLRTSTSTPTASGAKFATSVAVLNNSGRIPEGTFIRFDNHSKVYMTTNDLVGTGTLGVYPPLREAVSNTVFKHRDDVVMTCLRDVTNIRGMSYTDGILMDLGTVNLLEKL